MSSGPNAWPAERIALMEQLWRDGVPASQIALALNTTRSAILGKLSRLKLLKTERANLTPGQQWSVAVNAYKRGGSRPIKLPALPKAILRPPMKNIPIQELTTRSCRWIEADPRHVHVVLYCGEKTVIGASWCLSHYRRVYPRSALEVAA